MGIISFLDKHKEKRIIHFIRSLFAVYDIIDMAELNVAWWNYNVMDEVNKFLSFTNNADVFEYGSGASTIWLAKRAGKVISIEHNKEWYEKISLLLTNFSNNKVYYVPATIAGKQDCGFRSQKKGFTKVSFKDYVNKIAEFGEFDLIIIDGRARNACLDKAIKHLKSGGIILFDDTSRERYMEKIDKLSRNDWEIIHFKGLTPCLPYRNQTSLIKKKNQIV